MNEVTQTSITTSAKRRPRTGAEEQHSTGPTVEEIQLRAYEMYVSRGRIDGQDLEDWLQAEKELAKQRPE